MLYYNIYLCLFEIGVEIGLISTLFFSGTGTGTGACAGASLDFLN